MVHAAGSEKARGKREGKIEKDGKIKAVRRSKKEKDEGAGQSKKTRQEAKVGLKPNESGVI